MDGRIDRNGGVRKIRYKRSEESRIVFEKII
jgi:hypothetical protein